METGKVTLKKELDWKLIALVILAVVALYPLLSKVPKVEKAIAAIGTVTLDSEEAIVQAEEAYAALKPEQQAKVDNYGVLTAARSEYECQVVENAIESIGKVTLDSDEAIAHAEELYEALSNTQRENVDNSGDMFSARKSHDKMVSVVQKAMDAIDAIGTVTLQSGNQVTAAREAVNVLVKLEISTGADLQSALGNRMTVLADAEDAYEALYVEYLYEKAVKLYDSKDYSGARAAFLDLAAQYPKSKEAPMAKEQAFFCNLNLAEAAHNKGDQYTAMKLLKEDSDFSDMEAYKTLMDKITKKLTATRPLNGAKMSDLIAWGWCELRVTAADADMCVRIVSRENKDKVTMFYIRKGETASAKLENGSYDVYYTTGQYWFDKTLGFGDTATYGKITGQLSLNSWISGNMVYYYRYDLDLKNKSNSDFYTETATASQFWGK